MKVIVRRGALLLLAGVAGCGEVSGPAPEAAANLFGCLFGEGLVPGGVIEASGAGAQTICLGGAADGADYLLVPFLASEDAAMRLVVEISGTGIRDAVGPPLPARLPTDAALPAVAAADGGFHQALRRRERAELAPRIAAARAAMRAEAGVAASRAARTAAVPVVGELLPINVPAVPTDGALFEFSGCERFTRRTGRVEAVSQRAIVVADTANPRPGFSRADYEHFAVSFDTLVHPVAVRHFGEPTDIDRNGRAIIFFSGVVNALTAPDSESVISGFFWGGDLFPPAECRASNQGEIFYQLVPDARRTPEQVRRGTVAVLGHEYQHLINAGRRLYVNNAATFEEVWLNEALSHVAEELLFYQAAGLGPRRNLDVVALRQSQRVLDAFNRYGIENLIRFSLYLENPMETSLLGVDDLPTRGAGWAYLRYAADGSGRPDEAVFRSLVNARTAGVENLRTTFGTDPLSQMQAWTVSVYADDAVPNIAERYRQPSWNFRSIMPVLLQQPEYPLRVERIPSAAARELQIRAGGAAFVRFGVAPGGRATLRITSAGAVPPERLRVSIMRTR